MSDSERAENQQRRAFEMLTRLIRSRVRRRCELRRPSLCLSTVLQRPVKEDKKANLESISILLSPYLKAQFDLSKCTRAKQLFADPKAVVDAETISITEVKFLKKNPIPTISVDAVFKVKVTDTYVKENEEDGMWQVRHGGQIGEAISIGWSIDHWGVENLDLSMGDYKESGIYIENE